MTFIAGHSAPTAFKPLLPDQFSFNLLSAFGVAMVAALWAYDGWNNTTYVAAEVREPQKNIPRAVFLGTSVVVIIYLAANWAYAYLLPISEIAGSNLVAADAMTTSGVLVLRKKWPHVERPYKTWGYPWIPIAFILVSILFVINTLITDPRDSLFGLIIVAFGVPAYLFWNYKSKEE